MQSLLTQFECLLLVVQSIPRVTKHKCQDSLLYETLDCVFSSIRISFVEVISLCVVTRPRLGTE